MAELRQSLKALFRSPGFTAVTALTLALGIGISTAVFSVVNGVLLQPLHFPHADRVVSLGTKSAGRSAASPRVTGGDFVDMRAGKSFEAISYYAGGDLGVQVRGAAEFTGVYIVNADFFRIFGSQPEQGRFFNDKEPSAAVVSASFAVRHFGAAQQALGRILRVENKAYTITGILGGARFPAGTEIWLPGSYLPESLERTAYNYKAVALLKPGVDLRQAQSALNVLAAQLQISHPNSNRNKTFAVTSLQEQLVGPVRTTLYLLLGAVFLVLLISCANVSNLLLARAAVRTRELAIRAALGASRARLIGQMISESVMLAVLAGAIGLLFAFVGTRLLVRLAPANLPRLEDVHVDPSVLGFSIAISLISALLFGLAPAWQSSRVDIGEAVKQGGARGLLGGRSQRFRGALVVTEIALAFVLATGAGLLFRSLLALNAVELGYKPDRILVMYAHLPARTLDEYIAAGRTTVDRLLPQLAALPGVQSAGAVMGLPTGKYGSNGHYAVTGKHQFIPGAQLPDAGFRLSSPNYFATLRVPVVQGRDFTPRDRYDAPFVAIVSESLVRQIFPNENPLGRQIICGLDSPKPMTIVGVVGDVRSESPATAPAPEIYMPLEQHPYHANELQVIVRSGSSPSALTRAVRDTVRGIRSDIAIRFTTLDAMLSDSVAAPRFRTSLVASFALLALLLAMAGIYSVTNYLVSQRTPELGLRMALGASAGNILRLVLSRSLALAAVGLIAGATLSLLVKRLLESMLFGLSASDPTTYAAGFLAVLLVSAAAAFFPARRASRIHPMSALREE